MLHGWSPPSPLPRAYDVNTAALFEESINSRLHWLPQVSFLIDFGLHDPEEYDGYVALMREVAPYAQVRACPPIPRHTASHLRAWKPQ